MNAARRSVLVVLATVVAVLGLTGSASAAVAPTGYDVSYPQCGKPLPSSPAFGVVGVNGGLATTANPCLAPQLTWAWKSSGAVAAQPKAQVYLNTANPGEIRTQVKTWPTAGSTPYGTCDGSNSSACSWQYGWERAQNSVLNIFTPAAHAAAADSRPASYTWWLDVETGNTWQSGSSAALTRNRATLEGMTAYLVGQGGRIGFYSTSSQWTVIVGSTPTTSNLAGRNSWLPGATTLNGAIANCVKPPLTPGGHVTLTQYVANKLDSDHSCV
ncbi:MAG: hypothetical protein QOJ68_2646 [Blastococcus sp.]|jgi:hypothetical protein|nr:hypothetical protein [Blastococcus sp.]